MAYTRYFISCDGEDWTIQFNGEEFGPYRSHAEARLFAIEAAKRLGARGHSTQVCLMGEGGHFHPEWTYRPDAASR